MKTLTIELPDHVYDGLKQRSSALKVSEKKAIEIAIRYTFFNADNFFEVYNIVVEPDE